VQEQRFFAAAIEDKWITALQPGDQLPLASFVREEERDRVLLHRLTAGAADVDQLSARSRLLEYSCGNLVIVNDDVSATQALLAMDGDEAGVSWPGSDQIHSRILH
jgi:hypothetical protein